MRSASLETSESVASVIASVGGLAVAGDLHRAHDERMRAAGGEADHERALVDAAEAAERLLRRARRRSPPARRAASAGGAGRTRRTPSGRCRRSAACRRRRSPRSRPRRPSARPCARGLLDVDVVGGDGLLERVLVEREQRRRDGVQPVRRAARSGDGGGGTPRAPPPGARGSPRTRAPARSARPSSDDVLARRASSSAVWKATSSRWSTTYCATSFWERENSSNRELM